jgi:hypothetical protein
LEIRTVAFGIVCCHHPDATSTVIIDQVADFGLARLAENDVTHVSTRYRGYNSSHQGVKTENQIGANYSSLFHTQVLGSRVCVDGEGADREIRRVLGVVLLELMAGRKSVDSPRPIGDESPVEWVSPSSWLPLPLQLQCFTLAPTTEDCSDGSQPVLQARRLLNRALENQEFDGLVDPRLYRGF